MSDEDAYMALALCNAQSELHPLEVGIHALKSGLTVRDYAARVGVNEDTLQRKVQAARVVCHVTDAIDPAYWRSLAEIHAAPRWLWVALASQMADDSWTVEKTRAEVRLKACIFLYGKA